MLLGKRVTKVDPAAQTAFLSDGSEIKYDKCLIATGYEKEISFQESKVIY